MGQYDKQGGAANGKLYRPNRLISPIFRAVIDPSKPRLIPGILKEITQLPDRDPIDRLEV